MIFPTLKEELSLWEKGFKAVVGIDEVGRGCFAGPVVVGAVIFSKDSKIPEGIADSKKLSAKKREQLEVQIKKAALGWAVAEVSVETINNIGIGKATQQAFVEVLTNLKVKPDFILIDAFLINGIDPMIQKAVISGDQLVVSISAASIIAKVYRDNLMQELDKQYPEYGLAQNKGYGTKVHRDAIKKHGLCPLHRTSFNLDKFL